MYSPLLCLIHPLLDGSAQGLLGSTERATRVVEEALTSLAKAYVALAAGVTSVVATAAMERSTPAVLRGDSGGVRSGVVLSPFLALKITYYRNATSWLADRRRSKG